MPGFDCPIVPVHGIWNSPDSFSKMSSFLRSQGWHVLRGPALCPNTGTAPLEKLSGQLSRYIETELGKTPFHLVGFSMGGLVSRHYLQVLGGEKQVQHFVSIAAPQAGTLMAYLLPLKGFTDMRPNSEFIRLLSHLPLNVPTTAIYCATETHILPYKSSILPQAQNIKLRYGFHISLLKNRAVIQHVHQSLCQNQSPKSLKKNPNP
jgi:triacylglycerol lipase